MHLLIILHRDSRVKEPADVDDVISAEFPDPDTERELFDIVLGMMTHQCGDRCTVNGKCSKGFPKPFREATTMDEDAYVSYRRRNTGRTYKKKPTDEFAFDNRHVVPYNKYLSKKYRCHINLECCISIKSVKYVHKYIYKGPDRATLERTVQAQERDEIKEYLDSRYISASEAIWRIFEFRMHAEVPNIVRLSIHVEMQQQVVMREEDTPQTIEERGLKNTTLMGYFAECARSPEARRYLYQEFPQHYVWDVKLREWTLRKQGFALGRMYYVPPIAGETFYLRTLLTVVRGPTSFTDLRTVDNHVYATYQQACLARGLLEDDGEWRQCLADAAVFKTGEQLRALFVMILRDGHPSEPDKLWDNFKVHLCDDLRWRLRRRQVNNPSEEDVYDYGLYLIDCMLKKLQAGTNGLAAYRSMPRPVQDWNQVLGNHLIAEQQDYDVDEQIQLAVTRVTTMNADQKKVLNAVVDSVSDKKGTTFFLSGPAGTGKTFCYRTICHKLRGEGKIVLCVASSGIAALLLQGGRMAHSMFKIPLNPKEDSVCNIKK